MVKPEERIKEIELEIKAINQKVSNLEKAKDSYIASHKCINFKIYNEIDQLLDRREKLLVENKALNSVKV